MTNTANIGKEEAKIRLLEQLRSVSVVRNSTFAKEIGATKDTMRRAAKELKNEKLIEYHHGISKSLFGSRPAEMAVIKKFISVKPEVLASIAELAKKDQAIVLDLNPIAILLAKHLPVDFNALIVTNSPVIAAAFAGANQFQVRVIGGEFQEGSFIPVEDDEFKFIKKIRASLCVLGSCCVDLESITSSNPKEAKLKEAMVGSASKVVISLSAESLNKAAAHEVAPLESLTHIVLENDIPAAKLKPYKAAGIVILRA